MHSGLREEQGSNAFGLRAFESTGGGCRLEFEPKVLEALRFESSRAMNGVGGLGIGGVLLGTQAGQAFRVFGWRPIPCDHSRGPAFTLSERDVAGLASFLDGVRADAAARHWRILGWFVSHPKGGMSLSEEERALQQRFFLPDGIIMMAHPDRMGDAECTVLVDGGAEKGFEFRVEPLPLAKRDPGERRARSHSPAPKPATVEYVEPAQTIDPPRRRRRWWGLAVLLLATLGASLWAVLRPAPETVVELPPPPPIEMLSLHAGPRGGRFVIEWNGQSPAIRFASRVSLLITDGGRVTTLPLSRQDAAAGLQFFRPESEHVIVVLRLESKQGEAFEETTEYDARGAAVPPAERLSGEVISSAGAGGTAQPTAAESRLNIRTQTPAVDKQDPAKQKTKTKAKRSKRKRSVR